MEVSFSNKDFFLISACSKTKSNVLCYSHVREGLCREYCTKYLGVEDMNMEMVADFMRSIPRKCIFLADP